MMHLMQRKVGSVPQEVIVSARVVVGVDGSQRGMSAVAWARDDAVRRRRGLEVVYVAEPSALREPSDPRLARVRRWMRDSAQEVVDEAVAAARQGGEPVEVTGRVRYGEPARELLAASERASLLVTGSRGGGGFTGLLLGSVALHVTAHAVCPVVVVRADDEAQPRAYRTVVAGVDGSAESLAAARFGAAEAELRGARLRVLRAWSSPLASLPRARSGAGTEEEDAVGDDGRTAAASVAELRPSYPDLEIVHETVRGRPAGVLTAASAEADLVVVGSRGRSALRGLVLGSVSHAVLHHARCPVGVLRS